MQTQQHQHEPISSDDLEWLQAYDFTMKELEAQCANPAVIGAACYSPDLGYIGRFAWADDRQRGESGLTPHPFRYCTESEIELAFEIWVQP